MADTDMTDLAVLKRLYRYLLEQGRPDFASEVDDAFREIRSLREQLTAEQKRFNWAMEEDNCLWHRRDEGGRTAWTAHQGDGEGHTADDPRAAIDAAMKGALP